MRDLDGGEERVEDLVMLDQLSRQAREVHIEAALLGAALTGLALLTPG